MNLYYIHYYRDFCNTYTVYAVPAKERDRFETFFPDADRISRARAIERGIRRPAEAKRDGEQWYAGLCEGGAAYRLSWPVTVSDRLKACALDTMDEVSEKEAQEQAEREYYASLS